MSTLQFYIARAVADALPIDQIASRARAAGLARPRIEYSTVSVRPGTIRITCQLEMGLFLVEELRLVAGHAGDRNDEPLLIATAAAVSAIFDAIRDAERFDSVSPANNTKPAPN